MIKFKYSALDETNTVVNGEIEAESEREACDMLAALGKKPIRINADILAKTSSQDKTLQKISSDQIALFCKQLSIITRSGISITKGLLMVRNQSDDKKIAQLAENLHMGIQKGCSLSEAFKTSGFRLPLLLINMVQVGEASGDLDGIFKKMSEYFENESRIKKKVIGALIYPAILVCVSIGVIIVFTFFILPELVKIIEDTGGTLPMLTQIMMGSAHFVKNNILYLAGGTAGAVIAYLKIVPYETRRKWRGSLLFKLPVVSNTAKDFMTARFVRTMGILINTGLSMLVILETLEKVMGNEKVSRGIADVRSNINKGEGLAHSLERMEFFDGMVTNIIAIGEDTGNLGESMLDLADYYDEKFDAGVSKLISLLEPAFTLIMGGVIATILLSAMLPMFNMIGSLSNSG